MIKAVVIAFIILMLLPAKGNKAKDKRQHRPWYDIRYDDTRRLCYKMEIRLDHRKCDSAWFRFEGANTENAHAAKPHTKCMKNGILGMRSKAGGRYVTKSA